ncbi:tRNA a64-2'-o-ribosylphosphate transferase like protein [Zymoseptoria brevis]|uniref:tRNA a64-2'-o-ribosylphosphate transferase like protein n=1 Tax=Zymoseptoria brevis TaxID=1047168 RepID=A0A0F4GYL2_9PEZI|nr:tRNA a64-2'-o-ribosylphosphate transferase like protein [Zymoseptoria brevis]
MAPPLQESDLIFPTAASSLKNALGDLKRANLTIKNRLTSIKQDSSFVEEVANAYQLPLIANERCGSWYIPPHRKAGSAYFKSTDGHFGQWMFSLRRLNLQVLDAVGEHGGCIIVDSTRRGKSMPDALSKTVPIWTTILNRLLFPHKPGCHNLQTPMDVVSGSEHAQMELRLDTCLRDVQSLKLDLNDMRSKLQNKPMQIVWQRPGDQLPSAARQKSDSNLLVLCTASNQTSNETSSTSDYVQGAADDPESWSLGLDAAMFWTHLDLLRQTSEDELSVLIAGLIKDPRADVVSRDVTLVRPTSVVYIGDNSVSGNVRAGFDLVVSCFPKSESCIDSEQDGTDTSQRLQLTCADGKVGSRQLRHELPKLEMIISSITSTSRVLVTCQTGKDLAVGVALALLCRLFDGDGIVMSKMEASRDLNKSLIKQRLSWIMVSMPDASPSRATLQSVNAFLLA